MSDYYDTPCEVCGEGIPRTGKRGRPPKVHPACKGGVQPVKNAPTIQVSKPLPEPKVKDPEDKVIDNFLKAPATRTRSPVIGLRDDRFQDYTRNLVKGDRVYFRQEIDTVISNTPDGREHNRVKFKERGELRLFRDGNVYIMPRELKKKK